MNNHPLRKNPHFLAALPLNANYRDVMPTRLARGIMLDYIAFEEAVGGA